MKYSANVFNYECMIFIRYSIVERYQNGQRVLNVTFFTSRYRSTIWGHGVFNARQDAPWSRWTWMWSWPRSRSRMYANGPRRDGTTGSSLEDHWKTSRQTWPTTGALRALGSELWKISNIWTSFVHALAGTSRRLGSPKHALGRTLWYERSIIRSFWRALWWSWLRTAFESVAGS